MWLLILFVVVGFSNGLTPLESNIVSSDTSRNVMSSRPMYLDEARVTELLDGQWLALIDAMHEALVNAALKNGEQPPRSFTSVDDEGILLTMPGYVGSTTNASESVLACKVVTVFGKNSERIPPLPSISATTFLFDIHTGKLYCILESNEITARRTAASSVAATNILWKRRHSNSSETSLIIGIFGAGVQGKNHALAFHAAYPEVSEIRIWNHRLTKAEQLVAELHRLGVSQAVVASTGKGCAEGADILVTVTFATEPILRGEWVKEGAHINAVGAGLVHYSELDLPLYQRAKIYLDDEEAGRKELNGLEDLGISLLGPVGVLHSKPELIPTEQDVTVFHSLGMAFEDAAAAQFVYKRHLATTSQP